MSLPFFLRVVGSAVALAGSVAASAAEGSSVSGFDPLPGETVFVPELRGVITVPEPSALAASVPEGFTGVDTTATPLVNSPGAEEVIRRFLGRPMSFGSLDRLCIGLRMWLRVEGQPFTSVYAPPQEIADGVIRLVVSRATLEGEVAVEGAKYFSADAYRAAASLVPGTEIDAQMLSERVAWLNENPYRSASMMAEAGRTPGSTRLTLRVQEQRPWRFSTGYSNAGTAVTGEDRLSASVAWGNAFGRGDQLGYSFSADPDLAHSRSHSGSYTTVFRSRRSLTLYGAYSEVESELPAPLTQEGTSWQAGMRFGVPLRRLREGWAQNLAFTADFKASDNTLEFATIPVTDNLTHIVQFGASYGLNFPAWGGRNSVALSGYLSPGGLSSRNRGRYFDQSRPGAKAQYAYVNVVASHQHDLGGGFWWSSAATAQWASEALLGTEQLNGGGAHGVRGYRESTAFGDYGVVMNHELHLPSWRAAAGRTRFDGFGFFDLAMLGLRVDRQTTHLHSAGVGVNALIADAFSVRAAVGWPLKDIPANGGSRSARAHVSAQFSF